MMNDEVSDDLLHREAFELLCGELIASGMSRSVYVFRLDTEYVVKVEDRNTQTFQNVSEWQAWQAVKDTPYRRWFAPIAQISGNGRILIMKRTKPATKFPERMPAFLGDFWKQNYGTLDGRLVCHDYGVHYLYERGLTSRMLRAKWECAERAALNYA